MHTYTCHRLFCSSAVELLYYAVQVVRHCYAVEVVSDFAVVRDFVVAMVPNFLLYALIHCYLGSIQ